MRARGLSVLFLAVIALLARAQEVSPEIVLVTSRDNNINAIPTLELRKIYLGIKVSLDGVSLTGYMRSDDKYLREIFLQSVLGMSEQSFDRRSLLTAIKYGTRRPEDVAGAGRLADELRTEPMSVGYMWRSEADSDARIRVLQVLWREN